MKILRIIPSHTIKISVIKKQYIVPTQQPDTISFSGKITEKTTDLRDIPDVPCACCGRPTIKNSEIDKLLLNEIHIPALEALNILKEAGYFNKNKTSKQQRDAYTFCKKWAELFPNKCIKEIMEKDAIIAYKRNLDKKTRLEVQNIENMVSHVYRSSEYMTNKLAPFEKRMNKTEQKVFQLLKKEAKYTPQWTFTEILSSPRIRETHLRILEKKQGKIFKNVEETASKMSPESYKIILRATRKAKIIFDKTDPLIQNKRTYVLEMFKELESKIPEKELMNEIITKIYNLPSSKNDISSFIIKYGTNNPNSIADSLLRGSSRTIEHVKPRRRRDDNGENSVNNFIVFCRNCNSERAQTPYAQFSRFHPDMPQNSQKYLDVVIDFINKGKSSGLDKYPENITKSVQEESDYTINLNYRKLNLLEAIKNKKKHK